MVDYTHKRRPEEVVAMCFDGTMESAMDIASIFGEGQDFEYHMIDSIPHLRIRGCYLIMGEYIVVSDYSRDVLSVEEFNDLYEVL